jgi:hypothetical protein
MFGKGLVRSDTSVVVAAVRFVAEIPRFVFWISKLEHGFFACQVTTLDTLLSCAIRLLSRLFGRTTARAHDA